MKQQTYLLINSVCYLLATTMLDEVLFRYDTVIYYWLTDWQYCVSSRRRYETLDIRIRRFESYISAAISDRRTPCYHSSPFSPYGFKIPSLNHTTTLLLYSQHTMFRCFKRIIHGIGLLDFSNYTTPQHELHPKPHREKGAKKGVTHNHEKNVPRSLPLATMAGRTNNSAMLLMQ